MEDRVYKNATMMKRYNNDPEYRKKHNEYMCEKVFCLCGKYVARGNMSNHKKTEFHKKFEKKRRQIENEKLKKIYEKNKRKLSSTEEDKDSESETESETESESEANYFELTDDSDSNNE